MCQSFSPRSRKGFTLVELAVVIVIIGVLAAFGVPRFLVSVERSKAAEAFAYLVRRPRLARALSGPEQHLCQRFDLAGHHAVAAHVLTPSAPAQRPIILGAAPSPARVRRPAMAPTRSPSRNSVSTPPTATSRPRSIPWGLAAPAALNSVASRGVDVAMLRAATRWAVRFLG